MTSPAPRKSSAEADAIRILVVGVNYPVASKAYALLSEAGIDVLSAGDTARALEICRWSLRPIDVLLSCDHLMDDVKLEEFRAAAAATQPTLRCIRVTMAEASDTQSLLQRLRQAASKSGPATSRPES